MQFIVNDQRIAVEKFQIGKIYTIKFATSYLTTACVGIGADFVAFQRTRPDYIFILSMETAADVVSIDLSVIVDTVSGQPPLSFISDGSDILHWTMYGNTVDVNGVGDKTANLFDVSATDTTNGYVANAYLNTNGEERSSNFYNISEYIDISGLSHINISNMKPSGSSGSSTGIGLYDSDKILIASSDYAYGIVTSKNFSVPSNAKYIRISYNKSLAATTMLNAGETALPYEPYGYKIPILCSGETTTIYLDTPLYNGNSISMADTGIEIPTTNGQNTLTVDTTVQPSNMIIQTQI